MPRGGKRQPIPVRGSLKVKASGEKEDLLPPHLSLTAIGLKASNWNRNGVYFLTYLSLVLGKGWHPKECGELLREEEGMDAGWPGTPVSAHDAHAGGMGLNDVLFSRCEARKGTWF